MSADIDYYFCLISPFSFMGLARLRDYAGQAGSTIRYKPVDLPKLYGETGTLPLAQRPQARKDYRFVELERWRSNLALDLNVAPKFFPADESFAARVVAAAIAEDHDPGDLCQALHEVVWIDEQDIADPDTVAKTVAQAGYPEDLLDAAKGEEADAAIAANTAEAAARGVFGVPTYIIEDEPFWGQDRLDFVARKLGLRE